MKKLFDKWGVRHFSPEEVTLHRQWGKHVLPPESKKNNIHKTILLADTIREVWGDPVRCNSGYRSPEYNKLVGGSEKSEHVEFRAMDLSPINGDIKGFSEVVRAVVEGARTAGWNVGVGFYSTFCHIDVDAEGKKKNRSW